MTGTDYQAKCGVIILEKVTIITPTKTTIQIEKGSSEKIEVTTIPSENVEELKYESANSNIATVDEKGIVTGVTEGETTVTISGKVTGEGRITVNVKIVRATIPVTAEEIIANPAKYYGKPVVNYLSNATYRIFYVDKDNYFGDGKNTIYLKADVQTELKGSSILTTYTSNTLIKKLNPQWNKIRGNASWVDKEKRTAWLCDPESKTSSVNRVWSKYYDENKANYVVGGPWIELYVRSYNQVSHATGIGTIKIDFIKTGGYYGYVFGTEDLNSGIVDYQGYSGIYHRTGKESYNGGYWLSSLPASDGTYPLCIRHDSGMKPFIGGGSSRE